MQLTLIKNPDETQAAVYKIARVIFAETGAVSLHVVEAMASMIQNAARVSGKTLNEIVADSDMFDAVRAQSPRNELMNVSANDRGFQMCLRVVRRMMRGNLADACRGAVRFHRADELPQWAVSRGYIADIDGLLFYL